MIGSLTCDLLKSVVAPVRRLHDASDEHSEYIREAGEAVLHLFGAPSAV